MKKCAVEPIVRHSYAPDPDPEKVKAALELWRRALARKLLEHRPARPPGPSDGAPS